jgi:hypothetical protein
MPDESIDGCMNNERRELLTLSTLPARLSREEAAHYLGFKPDHIALLIRARPLKPLGHPAANADKYFAAVELAGLREDVKWLGQATQVVSQYWKEKNARKSKNRDGSPA